jgi:hypothetical protein
MSIVAKFPGTCTSCSKPIVPGQTIEWRKGAGSHHLDCSSTASAPIAPATPGKSCYRHSEAAKKCGTCGGTAGKRGAYGRYEGGTCSCCRPNCNCYDCRS